MVKQYPHTITVTGKAAATRDDDGDWVEESDQTIGPIPCRFEANSKGAMIVKEDGTQVLFSGIVYLSKQTSAIKPGSKVEVLDGATVLSKARVLRFSNGQLNSRIWL